MAAHSGLIVAADMSALGEAARTLAGSMGAPGAARAGGTASYGHADADAAMQDFHSTMQQHEAALAAHAGRGAAALTGYLHAFHAAGE